MSHSKEREEKICLNCGAQLTGRYCHICGQENIEPKESLWHLVSHFFEDITHFDGKFFSTVKYLLFKPGFLSREYLQGRRASYLHPIRMYVFTSAFFFLIFFSFYKTNEIAVTVNDSRAEILKSLQKNKANLTASLTALEGNAKIAVEKKIRDVEDDIQLLQIDSTAKNRLKSLDYSFNIISFKDEDSRKKYQTVKEYDSLQKALPESRRDGFIMRRLERQNLHLKEKYKNDGKAILDAVGENFLHHFPQMLFVSLPLFALLLKLLYVRRKNIFYVNHAIYSIHLYCACFIIILGGLWMTSIFGWFNLPMPRWLNVVLVLLTFFYLYKSQRNFYGQRRAKTILKFLLLLLLSLIVMVVLFFCFLIFSTFTI